MTAIEDRSMRAKILDVRETRRMASPLEMRSDAGSGHIVLEGYAATFDEYDVHGGVRGGGWVEQIHRRAFDMTLGANPDVQLLVNHEGWPLARTKSGTLSLRADEHGLLVRADLDPSDPDVQRLLPKMRRKDMDEMSFAFHVRAQDWSSDYTHRMITEINLQKGDVSVVNYGMNPNTAAMLSDAVDVLASLSDKDLVEVRKMDQTRVVAAMQVLHAAHDRRPVTRASTPKKYADVSNFADPGYLDNAGKPAKDGNGKKRYPLNSAARVRNAAARFAQNKGSYTPEQQSAIMGKIKSAAKRFGVTIGDESKKWSSPRSGHRAFSQPYVWDPFGTNAPADPHDNQYSEDTVDYDKTLGGRPDVTPGTDVAGVDAKGGYDAHNEPYGPKQMYALYLLANDQVCPGGDMCPGDSCPDHGTEMNAMDGLEELAGDFGGKKAKPFKKPNDGDDSDGDGGEADSRADDDDDTDDERDDDGDDDQDERAAPEQFDLSLAAALEKTIIACYQMAEVIEDRDLRNMLARARRQVRDLQGIPGKEVDISRKLAALRSEFGDPDTLTVSEGLRAIAQAGFADTIQPKKEATP